MKISDVLWGAANERLWNGEGDWRWLGLDCESYSSYSCDAVRNSYYTSRYDGPAIRFLKELGCDTSSAKMFKEFKTSAERQGARYLWLMFAYLVALDEEL